MHGWTLVTGAVEIWRGALNQPWGLGKSFWNAQVIHLELGGELRCTCLIALGAFRTGEPLQEAWRWDLEQCIRRLAGGLG